MLKNRPLAALALATLLALPPGAQAFKCMPVYGNWCGIDYPESGSFPPPLDPFDAACMRHDLCTASSGLDTPCDVVFVNELRRLAAQLGYLPRPLQWAEYVIRVKAGGPWGEMPSPGPGDALGVIGSLLAPCW